MKDDVTDPDDSTNVVLFCFFFFSPYLVFRLFFCLESS